ncbi:MAG: PilZ domain-containing protein [Planctomycetota bacterium]
MIHDGVLEHVMPPNPTDERRSETRLPFTTELTIVWHHDLDSMGRYSVIDVSEHGLRVRSRLPMVKGMTGMALRLLPEGTPLDRTVMVRWVRKVDDGSGYDIGLSFLEA